MQNDCTELNTINETNTLDKKKVEIVEQAMTMELAPMATDIQVDLNKATKLPFGELTSLGTAFASLPETFRTVTQTVEFSGEGLFHVTDKAGNALDASTLFRFSDQSGLLGSFKDAAGNLNQAHLHPASSQTVEIATSIPCDPTTLFIAVTLMEVNKKLDAIQATQQEMFEYMKTKDKSKQRANLQTLTDILNNYRFHWGDKDYTRDKRNLVQFIKKDADEAIIQHRAEIQKKVNEKPQKMGLVHFDNDVRDKSKAVKSEFEEYRLAVYLYAFSSFLEVMLYENFSDDYLKAVVDKIEEHSISYRELYTQAYNLLEADADSSVRAVALGGLSGAMGFLSKAIESTPIGDLTPIDEALGDASKGLGDFSNGVKNDMMKKLVQASSSDVRPFIDNIENISRLYNKPTMLMADDNAVYVLTVEEEIQANEADSEAEVQ